MLKGDGSTSAASDLCRGCGSWHVSCSQPGWVVGSTEGAGARGGLGRFGMKNGDFWEKGTTLGFPGEDFYL